MSARIHMPSDPHLRQYLRTIQQYPRLSSLEEEQQLSAQMRNGCMVARSKLITSHLFAAASTGLELCHHMSAIDPNDAVSEATCALIEAVDVYWDPQRGRLSLAMRYRVRNKIRDLRKAARNRREEPLAFDPETGFVTYLWVGEHVSRALRCSDTEPGHDVAVQDCLTLEKYRAWAREALEALSPSQRNILYARHFHPDAHDETRSWDAVARSLGYKSRHSVERTYSRACAAFAKTMHRLSNLRPSP